MEKTFISLEILVGQVGKEPISVVDMSHRLFGGLSSSFLQRGHVVLLEESMVLVESSQCDLEPVTIDLKVAFDPQFQRWIPVLAFIDDGLEPVLLLRGE